MLQLPLEPPAAAEQLLALHGRALRMVAQGTGEHFAGLGQAARTCRLSSKLARQCRGLDACSGWLRHATGPRCDAFVAELRAAVAQAARTGGDGSCGSRSGRGSCWAE